MNATIVGASGYSGRELVSLLVNHPKVNLSQITSRSLTGKPVDDEIPSIRGKNKDLVFTNPTIDELTNQSECELFFLALPHGTAASYAVPLVESGKKVIDLSADFRLNSPEVYEEFYGSNHPSPEWLKKATYGLPEIHSFSWNESPLIASPGCYPTSILVPLVPILKENLIQNSDIIANSLSGVSGAGRNASEKLLFCERNESACAYGLPKHRHLSEIEEQLSLFANQQVVVSFHPHLAPMNRGICTTISVPTNENTEISKVYERWNQEYEKSSFVNVLPTGTFPEVAHVVGSNRIDISAHLDSRTNRLVICSTEDNLIKGAGGQAIQSMNICEGFTETEGLL